MKPISEELDPIQFPRHGSWRQRLAAWLSEHEHQRESESAFMYANAEVVARTAENPDTGFRAIVNIPADALLSFLKEGRYKNAYDRPVVMGAERGPSTSRLQVDQLLFGTEGRQYYFAAAAIGGCGIRFYGEYCLVLRTNSLGRGLRIFNRNSYDLLQPPLSEVTDREAIVRCLRGQWRDLVEMISMKVLPAIAGTQRLLTAGRVSEEVLRDEDFIEVHKRGAFGPKDVEEVRESPDDVLLDERINSGIGRGRVPTLTEILWSSRRRVVEGELLQAGVSARLVGSHARGGRWR